MTTTTVPAFPAGVPIETPIGRMEVHATSATTFEMRSPEGGRRWKNQCHSIRLRFHLNGHGVFTTGYTPAESKGSEAQARSDTGAALDMTDLLTTNRYSASVAGHIRKQVRDALEPAGRTWAASPTAVAVFHQAQQAQMARKFLHWCRSVRDAEAKLMADRAKRDAMQALLAGLGVDLADLTRTPHPFTPDEAPYRTDYCRWCEETAASGMHATGQAQDVAAEG